MGAFNNYVDKMRGGRGGGGGGGGGSKNVFLDIFLNLHIEPFNYSTLRSLSSVLFY